MVNCDKGVGLWNRAKEIIPGGNQLLSKRAEMYLPDQWPAYYSRAKGCEVWDLDGNHFTDMTIMGVGACTLGYGDPDVDAAVLEALKKGSMSTLNAPEEVDLAELLLELHPWAGGVRFQRTGGEAMAVAVRIARAHSRKDKIAFCGYHGWSDWYLASNLADDSNLDGHLLEGLEPRGVPRALKGTAIPFEYNDITELERIVAENDVGVVILEPMRHTLPQGDFIQHVREIATEAGAVLVVDEITIGWRLIVGGYHLVQGVEPDIAVFAKAMGNGYPMAAVVGKADVMDAAQSSFISSTYWTERLGPVAALATIQKMRAVDLPAHLDKIGAQIGSGWAQLAKKHGLNLKVLPPRPLVTMQLNYDNALELKTLFTQEMLKRGYLAGPSVYVCLQHTEPQVKNYLQSVDEVFEIMVDAIARDAVSNLLEGPVCHSGFQRLT